ncbi:asparaginase [bacterium]|nr:asparaginase [bacterium]
MNKKRILLITTGGTIAMDGDTKTGYKPILVGKDLLSSLPPFKDKIKVDINEYGNYPSPHITLKNMLEIRNIIIENSKNYDGFVITHGTDTLEETAYFLDLTLPKGKPVVLTAAMRSINELGLDGPRNIYTSIRVATDLKSKEHKVMVVLNDEIFDTKTVTKIDTSNISSFSSLYMGILGIADEDKIIFYRSRYFHEYYDISNIIEDVYLIKLYAGADSYLIEKSVERGVSGIVVEALGRGNVPPKVIPGIQKAIANKIPVLIVSRAYQGRVLDVYGYEGGGKQLKKMGCIFGGSLSGQKARIKLSVLLSKGTKSNSLEKYFKND